MDQYRQLWFTNMLLLGLKPAAIEEEQKVSINEGMFACINRKGSEIVLHFLHSKLEPELAKQRFRDCWPIHGKKQEQEFRKTCVTWIGEIAKACTRSELPRLCASLLLSPGGDKYYIFLYKLSKHVLLTETLTLADRDGGVFVSSFLRNGIGDIVNKDVAKAAMKAHIVRNQQEIVQRLSLQSALHKEWKAAASRLAREYQSTCKEISDLKKQLQTVRDERRSRLSSSVACSSADERVLTLSAKVTDCQRAAQMEKTRDMWGQLEGFEERGQKQREVVESVLEEGAKQHTVDAKHIKIHVPDALMNEYEELVRSGQISPLYQDGKLNLVSLLKLYSCALKQFRDTLRDTGGLPDFDDEKMRGTLLQQKTLLATLNQMRTQLDVLKASLAASVSKRLAKLEKIKLEEKKKSQATPTSCVFKSGMPPFLVIPHIEMPSLDLLPPTPEPRTRPHPHDHTHQLDIVPIVPRAGQELSTPEAIHNISQSVHRAASHAYKTADIGKSTESSKIPIPNKQPSHETMKKRTKLKKATPSTPHDSLVNTPKLSSSRFVKRPARSLATDPVHTNTARSLATDPVHTNTARSLATDSVHTNTARSLATDPVHTNTARSLATDPVHTNTARSLPSSTAYDKLADQIAEMVSSQSEEHMLLDPSPVTPVEELHSVTDTMAALSMSAFVSKDRIARTPHTKSTASKTAFLPESPLATVLATTNTRQAATPIHQSLTTAVSFQTTPTAALLSVQTPEHIREDGSNMTPERNFDRTAFIKSAEDLMLFATPLKHLDVPPIPLLSFATPSTHSSTPVLLGNVSPGAWIADIEPPTLCPDDDDFTFADDAFDPSSSEEELLYTSSETN